jgi:hypothetical protein
MSWIGDVKDLLSFRQERKKRQLDIEKLMQDSSRVKPATDEEVKEYDPKTKKLLYTRRWVGNDVHPPGGYRWLSC